MNTINIISKNICTGCSACITMCPTKCITMKLDKEQFLYPQIDLNKCIKCGKCLKHCPIDNLLDLNKNITYYVATAKDTVQVQKSSSGGAFYIAAKYVIEKLNGYVCGAVLDENLKLNHKIINRVEDIVKMQGSKYIQSEMGDCLKKIIKLLRNGEYVLFSGTPCQVAGLKKITSEEERKKLFTLDLICHGVPSAYAFSDSMKKMYGLGEYKDFSFRQHSKFLLTSFSYSYSFYKNNKKKNLELQKNEKVTRIFSFEDPFYQSFLVGNNYRESCYNCKYATSNRCGDITIGDCASSNMYRKLLGRSLSSVIINTEQGNILWEKIKEEFDYELADYGEEVKLNKQLHQPVGRPSKRNEFYIDLKNMKSDEFKKKYCPKRGVKEKIKHFLLWHIPVATRIKLKILLRRI